MRTYKKKIDALLELKKIQGQNGNWDYDPYMTGMYNGIELSVATIENKEPKYKTTKQRIISKYRKYIKNIINMLILKVLNIEIESIIEIARRI